MSFLSNLGGNFRFHIYLNAGRSGSGMVGDLLTAFCLGRYDFKLKPQRITKGIDSKSDPQNPGSKSQSEVLHGIQR